MGKNSDGQSAMLYQEPFSLACGTCTSSFQIAALLKMMRVQKPIKKRKQEEEEKMKQNCDKQWRSSNNKIIYDDNCRLFAIM